MKPALLVIDIQKEYYKINPQIAQSLKEAVELINVAIELFRAKNLPIFCIQHMNEKDHLVPGVEGFEIPDDLAILPSDPHIFKTYSNSFNKTPLLQMLQDHGIDTLILSGFCAEYCVLSTFRGAMDLDLTPIILRDSLASGSAENIKFVESVSEVISYRALRKFLE